MNTNGNGNGNGHKRAALYARVSTDEQKENGYGLIGQVDDCREYAARLGFEIVKELQEDYTGFSSFANRPVGKQLMEMVNARAVDAVIVARVDRIARDSLEARIAARAWLRAGLELHTAKNGHIKDDNDIVFLIETWQGQEDYTGIIKKLTKGRNDKAKSGKVVGNGRAPFGYKYLKNEKGTVVGLEIYESRAATVRLIFTWYVDGDENGNRLSIWEISKRLTELGIRKPGEIRGDEIKPEKRDKVRMTKEGQVLTIRRGVWSRGSVSKIINNEVYAGTWRYGRRIGKDGQGGKRAIENQLSVNVPSIVSRETWERAQAQREHNREMSKRNRKREYLLSGFIKCSCGRSMGGYYNTRTDKTVKHRKQYRCTSDYCHRSGELCQEKAIIADVADTVVWESIRRKMKNTDEFRADLLAAQADEDKTKIPLRDELQVVEEMMAREDAIILELTKRGAFGGRVGELTEQELTQANARYAEYKARRDKLIQAIGAKNLTDDEIETTMQFAEDVRAGIDAATYEDKRRYLDLLKIKATVKGGQIAEVTGVICFLHSKKCNTQYNIRFTLAPEIADQITRRVLARTAELTPTAL